MIRRGRSRAVGVPRRLIDDETLSFRALGVAVYVLSKPDHWRVDGRHLASTHAEGRDAVLTALAELEGAGYLVRRRYQDAVTGRWWSESVLYESLEAAAEEETEQPPSPSPENQDPGTQDPENRTSVNQASILSPKRDKPKTTRANAHPAPPQAAIPGPFRRRHEQPAPADKARVMLDEARAQLFPQPAEEAAS